ncbi:OmpA family protein [Neolewinella aurantiaca]|uniref:OmpA family protein n=1 Tax=Neolewinella aurantiaca TaxID=2602767 RepID=A0A5C7FTC0_9BACT|nr:PD40 domain-containing protein [Neolewinella aurantiaca]TXF88668.1 OmpA family protein [Neolewinella aurantiaca]
MPNLNHTISLIFLIFMTCSGLGAQVMISQQGLEAPQEKDPVLRADGQVLFFTRPNFENNKGTDNAADIWITNRNADGSWGRALNPGSPINSFAHDRALAISPDGNRLAVLRTGAVSYIDLLETSGRNWRVLDTWTLPDDVAPRYDLTFDPNGQQLIYSAYDQGNLNLFRREALPNGLWASPEAIKELNGPGNETGPNLAADGRTLYFQRDGNRWFNQTSPGGQPRPVAIPGSVTQFSPALNGRQIIAVVKVGSAGDHLQLLSAEAADLPPAGEVVLGQLHAPPPLGEDLSRITLNTGESLSVRPDILQRYAVFLRTDESLVGAAAGGQTSTGELATTQGVRSPASDRSRIEAGIARRQRELDRLDRDRRKFDLVAPKTEDPELAALRSQYREVSGDTLPPATTAKGTDTRYAAELSELERMKAKFRRQQNEKLEQRNRGSHNWSAKGTTPQPATAAPEVPSIGDSYRPIDPAGVAAARERAYQDSLRLAAEIRAGLQRDKSPRVYERDTWENEVRQGLPRKEPLSPAEVTRLDADYQRKLSELEALRAELHRLDGTTPTNTQPAVSAPPTGQRWSAKGDPYNRTATPQSYGQPSAGTTSQRTAPNQYSAAASGSYNSGAATTKPGGAPMPAGISFIPNTAYPDSRGYTGLDQLMGLIQQSTSVLEIRVHTPLDLDPRAAQLLSEERATTIRNFLNSKGIPAANYKVIGFGNNITGQQGERVEVVR